MIGCPQLQRETRDLLFLRPMCKSLHYEATPAQLLNLESVLPVVFFLIIESYTLKNTHLLQRHWGSTVVSERPTEAMKAKGQASNIMNAAMSRRMGNSVTVINAICETEKKQKVQLFSILLQFLFVKGRLQPTE